MCRSAVECLPGECKAPGLIPGTARKKKEKLMFDGPMILDEVKSAFFGIFCLSVEGMALISNFGC